MVLPVFVVAWIALASNTIASTSCRSEASHEGRSARRRRHLVFPKGSSITVTFAAGAYFDFNIPGVWAETLELTAAYPLPSTRLKFPPNHPNPVTHAQEHFSDHHNDLHNHAEASQGHVHKLHQEHILYEPLHRSSFTVNSLDEEQLMEKRMFKKSLNTYDSEHFNSDSNFKRSKSNEKSRCRRYVEDRHHFQREVASFLNMRGINGEACIIRARCEIAQRKVDQPPSLLQAFTRLVFMQLSIKDIAKNEAEFFKQCDSAAKRCPFSLLETHMASRW